MKFYICICFFFFAILAASAAPNYVKPTGQPGCQTEEEIATVYYRHFYLKNSYWVCSVQGEPATLATCPPLSGWLDDAKACVPWAQWYWTPTAAPPSEPVVNASVPV